MFEIKIAVPTDDRKGLDDTVAYHFGRCNTYTFLDENGEVIRIIDNTSKHMGGIGLPPELLKKHDIDVLLCRGIGPKALDLFRQFGIEVYVCQAETVKEIFKLWKNKRLKEAGPENACKEHRDE